MRRAIIDKRIELQIKELQENTARKNRCLQEIETEEYFRNISAPTKNQKRIQVLLAERDSNKIPEKHYIIYKELVELIALENKKK